MARRATTRLLLAACLVLVAACAGPSAHDRPRQLPPGHDGPYTLWFSDDQPKERGVARGGRRHGEVERYHPDGTRAFLGTLDNGIPDGRWQYYHEDGGQLHLVETWSAGALDGPREEYYRDGQMRRSTQYHAGLRHGLEQGWHPGGALAVTRHWREGVAVGRWDEFDRDGRLLRTEHHWVADGEEVGYLETVYTAPDVVSVQTLMRRRQGVWSGWETHWHANGVQAGYVEYEGGRRHGLDRSWARNGQLVVEGWRVDDERHGVWRTWSETGALVDEVEYSLGERVEPAPSPEG